MRLIETFRNMTDVPEVNKPSAGWYTFTCPQFTIFAHSAFFDDREKAGREPSIRLIIVSDIKKATKIYCDAWYHGRKGNYIKASIKTAFVHKNNGGIYQFVKSQGIFKEIHCIL